MTRSSRAVSKPQPRARRKTAKPYHHGDLRRVLIETSLRMTEEEGLENVSLREVARRAGVSPGAPFRHFENREALISAVADEAQSKFSANLKARLDEIPTDDPLARFRSFFAIYLDSAFRSPALFELLSRRNFQQLSSPEAANENSENIASTEDILAEAAQRDQLESSQLKTVQIATRAMAYGFARMHIDKHFDRWGVPESEVETMGQAVLDLLIEGIAKTGSARSKGCAPTHPQTAA